MKAVLLDSDVLIEVLRRTDSEIQSRWTDLGATDVLVLYSPVTSAEIWHGARAEEAEAISTLFSVMTCVPIEEEVGRRAGEYLRRFHRSHGIELGDALIAATAAVHNVPLWTRNRKHYPMREVRQYS